LLAPFLGCCVFADLPPEGGNAAINLHSGNFYHLIFCNLRQHTKQHKLVNLFDGGKYWDCRIPAKMGNKERILFSYIAFRSNLNG